MEGADMARRRKGFTLVELLAVIAIIGILAGFIFAAVSSAIQRGKITATKSTIHNLGIALTSYERDLGSFEAKLKNVPDFPTGVVQDNPSGNPNNGKLLVRLLSGRAIKPDGTLGAVDKDIREDPNWNGPYWDPNQKELLHKDATKRGAPVDSWGNFLLITIKKGSYDQTGQMEHKPDSFEIYSCGPNEIDDKGQKDDIANWE